MAKDSEKYSDILERGLELVNKITRTEIELVVFSVDYPSDNKIAEFESELGTSIPDPLKNATMDSSEYITWFYDEPDPKIPVEYQDLSQGFARWDLKSMREVELDRQYLFKKHKAKMSSDVQTSWANAFAFLHTLNADFNNMIALDLTKGEKYPVVMLNPENQQLNGYILSPTFDEFIEHWSQLAFIPLNLKNAAVFTENYTKPLNAQSPFAKEWISWLTSTK